MDRFIVGTGRCGSTLLSSMIAEHPAVLSLFEYFNGIDWFGRFAPEPISGERFGRMIGAEQPMVTAVLRRGYEVAEITYPFETGRYRREEPLPWVLVSTLPRLAADCDALFDDILAWLADRPEQPALAHHRDLFGWLAERTGRPLWIERSGSSFDYLGQLAAHFPEARFLHIHRDGPETALSMVHHHAYRLPTSLMYQAPLEDGTPLAELGPIDLHAAPTGDDPISRLLASRPPPERIGRYWCDQVLHGYRALRGIDAHRYREVRFEDLLAEPRATLAGIAAFFELPEEEGWLERAADLVRGAPKPRAEALAGPQREALEAVCRPGQVLLGRA